MGPFEKSVNAVLAESELHEGPKVDYWRTASTGHTIGFQGSPGKGKPVAGNPHVIGKKKGVVGRAVDWLFGRGKKKKKPAPPKTGQRKKAKRVTRKRRDNSVGDTIGRGMAARVQSNVRTQDIDF